MGVLYIGEYYCAGFLPYTPRVGVPVQIFWQEPASVVDAVREGIRPSLLTAG